MNYGVAAANAAWLLSCLPERRAFRRATRDVEGEQTRLLLAILRRNAGSEVGRERAFATVSSVEDFRARVPLSTYDDVSPAIERIANGERGVLTSEPVRRLEPTGGSSGGTKLVPYTASLAAEFSRGVDAWIADLFASDPTLLAGRSYWSITPPLDRERTTSGGVPVGFDDDAEYLGVAQRALARRVLAVPPDVARAATVEEFRLRTLVALAARGDLAVVSVWNPTFFAILLDELERSWERVVEGVATTDRRRASALGALVDDGRPIAERVWPSLGLVSCWADANAAAPAAALAARVPHARLQPKGLLATEAFVSFPLSGRDGAALSGAALAGAALAVRSHFLEFLPAGEVDPAAALGAWSLERGGVYSVVVTTGGGLYRYRLRDLVEVVGFEAACPLVRFVGREDAVSDWLGEKLDERHVARAVAAALAAAGLAPRFAVLSCEAVGDARAYVLFVDDERAGEAALARAAAALEPSLVENYHYANCRRLGQLGRATAVRSVDRAAERFLDACRSRGQRAGDVKPSPLYAPGELTSWLARVPRAAGGSDAR